MAQQDMNLVEFAKRLSETVFTMCQPHGDFYVAAKRQYVRLDDSDLNKKVFPDLFGDDAATAAEPDDIFLYWLGDWTLACKACLDPGTAESVARSIYGEADIARLRVDILRLRAVPGFPQRGSFQDIDALEYPTFLRAVAKIDPPTVTRNAGETGGSKALPASRPTRGSTARKAGVTRTSKTRTAMRTPAIKRKTARSTAKRKAAVLKGLVASKLR